MKVKWYGSRKDTNRRIVRGVPGVGLATYGAARRIGATAEMILNVHHISNNPRRGAGESISDISVERGGRRVDAFVNLTDDDGGAAAIESRVAPLKRAVFGG